jgi:hypothetical protein
MRCGNFFVNMSMDVLSSRRASCFETSSDKSCANSSPVQCVPADGMPCTHHGVGLEKAETRRKGCERPGSGTQGADDCTSTHNSYIHTHTYTTHTLALAPLPFCSLSLYHSQYSPPSHSRSLPLSAPFPSPLSLLPLTLKHCCSLHLLHYLHHTNTQTTPDTHVPQHVNVCVLCVCVCVLCVCVCVYAPEAHAQAHTYICIYICASSNYLEIMGISEFSLVFQIFS